MTGWSYSEIMSVPIPVVLLCEQLGWSYQELRKTPAQIVREFLVIANTELEMKRGR
jgi:hypothetical protein